MEKLRLGVNIDHVATVRNARGEFYPDPVRAALLATKAGADGITAHLREDRRHITDIDMRRLKSEITVPLNFEMAATDEMVAIALEIVPNACCLVPERREEVTTEGGLDVVANSKRLSAVISRLKQKNIRVSLFVAPEIEQIKEAKRLGADIVEIHTGKYCNLSGELRKNELDRIIKAASLTEELGIECHAGHGLSFDNVADIAKIKQMCELNIGHFLISEAIFIGLENAIKNMREIIEKVR